MSNTIKKISRNGYVHPDIYKAYKGTFALESSKTSK